MFISGVRLHSFIPAYNNCVKNAVRIPLASILTKWSTELQPVLILTVYEVAVLLYTVVDASSAILTVTVRLVQLGHGYHLLLLLLPQLRVLTRENRRCCGSPRADHGIGPADGEPLGGVLEQCDILFMNLTW